MLTTIGVPSKVTKSVTIVNTNKEKLEKFAGYNCMTNTNITKYMAKRLT